jgi:hypothetical protein
MFKIREWERFKFIINYEHEQACELPAPMSHARADLPHATEPKDIGASSAGKFKAFDSKED